MSSLLDALTDGQRERALMQRVRGGAIAPEAIAAQGLPFFVKIQIQTVSPCNAACVMCPWPQTRHELPQGVMREEVFERIVAQIAGRGVERVSLFLMNEPTLDRRLPRLTRQLKQREPSTQAVIYTNGVLLDAALCQELADAGMDEITVSVIGFDRETYARNMAGCDYDVVLRNLDAIGGLLRAGRLPRTRVRVATLDLPGVVEGVAAFRERTGLPVFVKPVTTRAGLIDKAALGAAVVAAPRPRACQRPFVKAYVLYNGDVVLCNCDWRRTTVYGNVLEAPLERLWQSAFLDGVRRAHIRGQLPADSLCARCDYPWLP